MMLKFLGRIYEGLVFIGGLLKSPILLLCRIYWGYLFISSGWKKFHEIDQFAELLQGFNLVLPYFQAYLAAATELIGGACLMLGFASRLASLFLAIVMLTAYSTVHAEALRSVFTNPNGFVAEAPFNFLLTTLIVFAFGPGRFSVDFLLEKRVFKKA